MKVTILDSLEEHSKIGGLGSALLEWLNDKRVREVELRRIGIEDHYTSAWQSKSRKDRGKD